MARKPIELGSIFGFLSVIDRANNQFDKNGHRFYCVIAECRCGTKFMVRESSLKTGNTKSCGCLQREHAKKGLANKRHGMSYSRLYVIWRGMRQRCTNPKSKFFHRYGGRGITTCEQWELFDNFYADMGPTYKQGLTLDREDNDGNYEPGNCRWADKRTQTENTSQVILVELDGEFMSTTAALRKLGKTAAMALDHMQRKGGTRQQAIDYYAGKAR